MKLSGSPSSFKTMRRCNYIAVVVTPNYEKSYTFGYIPNFLKINIRENCEYLCESTFYVYTNVYLEILETILRRKIKFSQFYQVNANCANYDEARKKYRSRKIDGSMPFIGKMDQLRPQQKGITIVLEKLRNVDSFHFPAARPIHDNVIPSEYVLPSSISLHPSIYRWSAACFLACLPNEFYSPREVKFTVVRLSTPLTSF